MKKILNFIICWACIFVVFNAKAQVFYDVCSTGQLLKYTVISSNSVCVSPGGDCEFSGDLVIPSVVVHNGISYSVTKIHNGDFYGRSGLTSLTIPNSVTTIPAYAFYGCNGLTSIVVEAGNPVYDSRNNCNAIINTSYNKLIAGCQTTIIPNTVTAIGNGAFWDCSGLTSLTIPNSVIEIGYAAFRGCSGLTSIVVEAGNPVYDSRNNCNAIIQKSNNHLILGCQTTVIPNNVTTIGQSAFDECSGLTSLIIPNSVTTIEWGAFIGCSGLTSLIIPNSVTTIGTSAFSGCSGLTLIVVEEGNPVYDSRNNCNAIINTSYNTLIRGCQTTTIPNTVTTIGLSAFDECSGLTSLTIPNSITTIGTSAFEGCSGLTSLTIPNSVMTIDNYAFSGCSGLTSIVVEAGNPVYDSRNDCNAIIQKSNNHLILGCQTTIIPNNVTTIGTNAFEGCSSLTSLTIPNSVTTIEPGAFSGCSGLTSLNIPDYVTTIQRHAFFGCSGLTTFTIPNSVTTIEVAAFYNCSGLTSITIPNSVTLIESEAFHKCVNLSSVRFEGITPPEFESAFYDVFPCIVDTIYVPEGCVENYSNAINNNSIVITDGHVGIDNHVVSNTLMVYPNPTSNIVNVECEMGNGVSGDVTIQLYDIYGKLLGVNVVGANYHSPLQRATAQIDLSRYANGVYFIKAVANGHVTGIRKVVKQ